MNWFRLVPRRFRPRCGALPPEHLLDAQPCTIYKGHEKDTLKSGSTEWFHWSIEDETSDEYLWNDTMWGWRGPVVNLVEYEYNFPQDGGWVFEERE